MTSAVISPSFVSPLCCSQLVLAGSDWTGDPGALEAAVTARDLLQVLLVLVLSVVEVLPLQDLGGDGTVAFFIQLLGGKKSTAIRVHISTNKSLRFSFLWKNSDNPAKNNENILIKDTPY